MEYDIIEFKPKEVPDKFWERFFRFSEACFKFHNPDDPLPNRDAIIQRHKSDSPHSYFKRFLAITPEEKIVGRSYFWGAAETSPEYEINKNLCFVGLEVLPDCWRQGIGTSLLKTLVKEAQTYGRTTLETGTNHDSGRAFLKKYGATLSIEGAENRLEMKDIDWNMMKSWVEEGRKRNEGASLESFVECPEEILDEFTGMYTEAINMAPQGDTEFRSNIDGKLRREYEKRNKEEGWINYTLISREKDGRISGMTEIYYDPRDGYKVHQELTGVRPEFRGRGRGKWLKAHMILYIKEIYPEVTRIITGNAESNKAMLSINERMGYKKYKGGDGYKFKIDDLVTRLNTS